MGKRDIIRAFKSSITRTEVSKKLGFKHYNGNTKKKLFKLIDKYNIDISHFSKSPPNKKYNKITKKCPICGKEYETSDGGKNKKITCSIGCANTYFRSGENNGQWKPDSYRSTCFYYHKKKCVICEEDKIVAVHHYDGNHNNNKIANLIPLCPTHHQYCHSRYKELIQKQLDEYHKSYLKRSGDACSKQT